MPPDRRSCERAWCQCRHTSDKASLAGLVAAAGLVAGVHVHDLDFPCCRCRRRGASARSAGPQQGQRGRVRPGESDAVFGVLQAPPLQHESEFADAVLTIQMLVKVPA